MKACFAAFVNGAAIGRHRVAYISSGSERRSPGANKRYVRWLTSARLQACDRTDLEAVDRLQRLADAGREIGNLCAVEGDTGVFGNPAAHHIIVVACVKTKRCVGARLVLRSLPIGN